MQALLEGFGTLSKQEHMPLQAEDMVRLVFFPTCDCSLLGLIHSLLLQGSYADHSRHASLRMFLPTDDPAMAYTYRFKSTDMYNGSESDK